MNYYIKCQPVAIDDSGYDDFNYNEVTLYLDPSYYDKCDISYADFINHELWSVDHKTFLRVLKNARRYNKVLDHKIEDKLQEC